MVGRGRGAVTQPGHGAGLKRAYDSPFTPVAKQARLSSGRGVGTAPAAVPCNLDPEAAAEVSERVKVVEEELAKAREELQRILNGPDDAQDGVGEAGNEAASGGAAPPPEKAAPKPAGVCQSGRGRGAGGRGAGGRGAGRGARRQQAPELCAAERQKELGERLRVLNAQWDEEDEGREEHEIESDQKERDAASEQVTKEVYEKWSSIIQQKRQALQSAREYLQRACKEQLDQEKKQGMHKCNEARAVLEQVSEEIAGLRRKLAERRRGHSQATDRRHIVALKREFESLQRKEEEDESTHRSRVERLSAAMEEDRERATLTDEDIELLEEKRKLTDRIQSAEAELSRRRQAARRPPARTPLSVRPPSLPGTAVPMRRPTVMPHPTGAFAGGHRAAPHFPPPLRSTPTRPTRVAPTVPPPTVPHLRAAPHRVSPALSMPPVPAVMGGAAPGFSVGMTVHAQYGARWHPARITRVDAARQLVDVDWLEDSTFSADVPFSSLRR